MQEKPANSGSGREEKRRAGEILSRELESRCLDASSESSVSRDDCEDGDESGERERGRERTAAVVEEEVGVLALPLLSQDAVRQVLESVVQLRRE